MCAKDSRGHYLRRVLIDMMTVACYMRNGYIIAEKNILRRFEKFRSKQSLSM